MNGCEPSCGGLCMLMQCPQRPEEDFRIPGAVGIGVFESLGVVLGSELRSSTKEECLLNDFSSTQREFSSPNLIILIRKEEKG